MTNVIVVCDSSQIEARLLETLAGQWDTLAEFEHGDPYASTATIVFERPITKKENPDERGAGKVVRLGSGFGLGGRGLREQMRRGVMGAKPRIITLETADDWIRKYRKRHNKVVEYWAAAEVAIQLLADRAKNYPWGPMLIDDGYIRLPNGTSLDYTGLVREEGEWRMRDKSGRMMTNSSNRPIRLYGGMMTENVVQALERVCVANWFPIIGERYPVVMSSHDEIAVVAPEREAKECLSFMIGTMTKRLSWLPELPLAAEGGFDVCYSK